MAGEKEMKKTATAEELNAVTRKSLRSFVPSETTIDGGLFPSRIGDGMLGYDYDELELAGKPASYFTPREDPTPLPPKRPLRER